MRMMLLVGLVVAAAACSSDSEEEQLPPQLELDAYILERGDLGLPPVTGIAESNPPSCGGMPIANWDWAKVSGEDSASGSNSGD